MVPENKKYYNSLRLKKYLQTNFPEQSVSKDFIARRGHLAVQVYNDAFTSGNTIRQCKAIADYVLFEGFHFSKFDTVFKIVCTEFATVFSKRELYPIALKMLPVCSRLFEQFRLKEAFADSPEFDMLNAQLTRTIQIWIEENGFHKKVS
ncbi:MAG: DUF1896 family protein [Lactococcus lactis]